MWQRIAIIVVVSFVAYFRTLRLKFVSDDVPAFQSAIKPKTKWQYIWVQLIGIKHFREEDAHLITLLIHTAVCVFLFLGLGRNDVSFWAALLFCLNPSNEQGSIWISGRIGYVLPTLGFLIGLSLPFIAPVCIFLATRGATSFIVPVAFIGRLPWWVVVCVPVIWFVNFKTIWGQIKTKASNESVTGDVLIHPRKLIIALKTYAFYLVLGLIPHRLTFYHSFMQSGAGAGNELMRKRAYKLDGWFFTGVLAVLGLAGLMIWHRSDLTFGWLWFSIAIFPYLNIIRVQQEIAQRYLYMANVGLMVALAYLIAPYPYVLTVFLTGYAVRLWFRIPAWTDDYWINEYAVMEDPGAWYAWHSRAKIRFHQGAWREALNMWVMARLVSPQEFKILYNIAAILRLLYQAHKKASFRKESDEFLELAQKYIIKGQEKDSMRRIGDLRGEKIDIKDYIIET